MTRLYRIASSARVSWSSSSRTWGCVTGHGMDHFAASRSTSRLPSQVLKGMQRLVSRTQSCQSCTERSITSAQSICSLHRQDLGAAGWGL